MIGTVGIVEDHDTMRQSLTSLLTAATDLKVQHQFTSGEEALRELEKHERPDLLLVDLALPQMNGIELISEITQRWPEVQCLVLSGQTDRGYVAQSFNAGAKAFILKGNPKDILDAVKSVTAGDTGEQYVSPAIAPPRNDAVHR
jgi:DNA-binding NarL/FixJ family response regulator